MKEIKFKLKGCGHPRFYEILNEHGILHDEKNSDYASSQQPLGNFERVGEWIVKYDLWKLALTRPALFTSIVYMLKQLDAAFKLLGRDEEGQVEGVPKRLDDISVYSIISRILYEENK